MVRKILEIHGDKDTNGSICGSIGGSSLGALFLVRDDEPPLASTMTLEQKP